MAHRFSGKETEVQESRIDYVMGSGNHVRTFLHQTVRGALIELPLAWYSENGGEWAMNPGHDVDYALPPRAVAYECMACHNSYPKIPAGHDEPGSEPLYAGALPEGIGCERCHGDGANHMRLAGSGAQVEDIRKAIVNPARLSAARQMEVCMQCHLELPACNCRIPCRGTGAGRFRIGQVSPWATSRSFSITRPAARTATISRSPIPPTGCGNRAAFLRARAR